MALKPTSPKPTANWASFWTRSLRIQITAIAAHRPVRTKRIDEAQRLAEAAWRHSHGQQTCGARTVDAHYAAELDSSCTTRC